MLQKGGTVRAALFLFVNSALHLRKQTHNDLHTNRKNKIYYLFILIQREQDVFCCIFS